MTDFDAFERRLAAAIRSDADERVGPFTPESIARAAIADTGLPATRDRPSPRPAGRVSRGRGMTLLAAAALLLVGGALAGAGFLQRSVVPPGPAPSVALLATASPEATMTPTPSVPPTPTPAPPSLDLTWTELPIVEPSVNSFDENATRVAWLGDRFVLIDAKSGAVRTSTDGQDWQTVPAGDAATNYVDLLRGSFASWGDAAVGWWNPEDHGGGDIAGGADVTFPDNVQISRPPAAPTSTTPFTGEIESIGIGPKGLVAQVHSGVDLDAWITKKLGLRTNNDWTCCVRSLTFKDGILELKLKGGRPGLKVVLADEGMEPGDIFDGGFGWYSPDGERWTAMEPNDADYPSPGVGPSNLPTGWGQVVGVSDGFIAAGSFPEGTCDNPDGDCTGIWFSSDGLTWRLLETVDGSSLVPWQGGALAIAGDGQATLWTSGGGAELAKGLRLKGTVGTGPLGIVSLSGGQVVVSPDGSDFKVSSLPAQITDTGNIEVAVGDRSVVVLHKVRTGEFEMAQSLWLGTFVP